MIKKIEKAGAHVITSDFPSAEEMLPPDGWDWEFGEGKRVPALSEFEVVRTKFYHSLRSYFVLLAKNENKMYSLEDIITYSLQHTIQEGGIPGTHPAWPTGQDGFDKCIESKDWPDDKYLKALQYIRRKSRKERPTISLDGLLVCHVLRTGHTQIYI